MGLQFPQVQPRPYNNSLRIRNQQNEEMNALQLDAAQRQFSEDERMDNTRWLVDVGQKGLQSMQQDAQSYVQFMPMIEEEGRRRGLWEKLGAGQFDYTVASPDKIMEGLQAMVERGQVAMGGQPQPDPKLTKDAAGYQRFAGGDNFGERAFPGVQAAPPGASSPTGSLQEINAINAYRDTNQDPRGAIDPENYLANRVRRSADMQAYNQHVVDSRKAGQEPMSEQDYAEIRAGGIAGSKTTGSGMAQRQLDIPQAFALHNMSKQNLTRLYDAVEGLYNEENLWKAVGVAKSIAAVPGQEGANLRAVITNIKSQVGFMVLQNMRNASKTGGALGQVSERENVLLQDNLASLSEDQSPAAFRKSLGIIMEYLREAQTRMDHAWLLTYPELETSGQPLGTETEPNNAPNGTIINSGDQTLIKIGGQWVLQQ